MTRREKKSPIKNLPVRMPGQSVREAFDAFFDEKALPWIIAPFIAILFAFVEWMRWVFDSKPTPWVYTIIAVTVVVLAVFKIRKFIRSGRAMHLGQVGEEAVGQYLEEKLRPMGCHVLHDIPGEDFNLDHVVVGPNGIFCIETKTRSKPVRGAGSVLFDGECVTVNGCKPERDPVTQAKAAASWLVDILEQSTGRRFAVHPVVLFPGWYVEQKTTHGSVWVLNEKALPAFIRNANNNPLSPEDVSLIVFHLKRYVISKSQ